MPLTNYMSNTGGLNISSSPLYMQDNQATGQSYNYDLNKTGAITKTLAAKVLNIVADTNKNCLGLGFHHDVATDARTIVRMAGTALQVFNPVTGGITQLSQDNSAANTSFLNPTSTQPVVSVGFNDNNGNTELWMSGGGMNGIFGYLGPNNNNTITQNGVSVPTGNINLTVNTHGGGSWPTGDTGTFFYGVQFRKKSTQNVSNVTLDTSAIIVNLDDTITIDLTAINNIDSTLYDQITIWRSSLNGVSAFTTGDIIAELPITATTFTDTGTSIDSVQNTPRPGNIALDNSVLPVGTYNYVTTFKRRLVAFSGSNIYISDLDKPESWPLTNYITITTGGPITGGSYIGNPSEYTTGADEYLCIWKEVGLWCLTGNSYLDWDLTFVDKTGCAGQSLVTTFNGWVTWMGYSGIYIWGGQGQPIRISRPIASLFDTDGDIDKTKLKMGVCFQYEKSSQIIWRISHRTKGFNKFSVKLDTRLTAEALAQSVNFLDIDGVFITDTDNNSYTGMVSFRPSTYDEQFLVADNAGFVYQMFSSTTSQVLFDYETKPLDMGHPEVLKRFKRVLVYIEKLTDNDLSIFYWTDYRIRSEYQSVVKATMAPTKGTQPALWDIALWDQASWDDYTPDIGIIEFNLHSYENNAEGQSLKLRFEQYDAGAPVRIHGFAIEWEPVGNLPLPTAQVS